MGVSKQKMPIPFTCVTSVNSWLETDNGPIFVEMHCLRDLACTQTCQIFVKYSARGNTVLEQRFS